MDVLRRIPASVWLIVAMAALVIGWWLFGPSVALAATEVVVDPATLPENQPSIVDQFLSPALLDRIQSLLLDLIMGLVMGLIYAVWAWVKGKRQLDDEDKKDIILERVREFARHGLEFEADLIRKRLGLPPGSLLSHEHDDEMLVGATNYVAKAGAESLEKIGIKVKDSALEKGQVIIEEGASALTNLVRSTRAIMKNDEADKAVAASNGTPPLPKLKAARIRSR